MQPAYVVLVAACLATPSLFAVEDGDGYHFGQSRFGAFSIPVPLSVQAQHDLVPGEGILVIAVRPGGTADRMGIKPGDVVLSLNESAIANRRDIRDVIATVQAGDHAHAVLDTGAGTTTTRDGEFQVRQPRPPGPPPWALMNSPFLANAESPWQAMRITAADQIQDLLETERALIDAQQAFLDAQQIILGENLPSGESVLPENPWHFTYACASELPSTPADAVVAPHSAQVSPASVITQSDFHLHVAVACGDDS